MHQSFITILRSEITEVLQWWDHVIMEKMAEAVDKKWRKLVYQYYFMITKYLF